MSTRRAALDDAPEVIPLLQEAIGSIAYLLTGASDDADAARRLTDFFKQPGNRVSCDHIIVEERDGRIAGMLVAYSGNDAQLLDEPFLARMRRDFGEAERHIVREAMDGEFYLDALAVDEAFRGQGIAKALMAAAEQRAKELGFERTALIVESCNERAHGIYLRSGYVEADVIRIGGSDYRRMVKEL
ncbi:GNAT family N-acetyltransferase [Paenibacillus rhizovicinus]|uniref:GNAT family N-acetyltransferase n=1 Tax=Paenibacillus rhizovicinus TaxID=2704463 RepID=A0A6C0P3P6_9BACL|nr:GNAT family N-acetyltransferase [Paenibacillus rhizovicinus]QHW32961.1 GNAT family N-acetyltransferase [Paenibacillus rhizovicinus]